MRVWIAALALLAAPLAVFADEAGDFDYYVLALSWSPNWCEREGDARGAAQCDRPLGWSLHGLWPQYEDGWPAECATDAPGPSARDAEAMADIMGSAGLARYQWRKHGSCSGLSGRNYLRLSRLAYEAVARPEVFRRLDRAVRLPASVVEEAFLQANPDLTAGGLTVTCRDGAIQEVRICLTRDLAPRACSASAARDCTLDDATFAPLR